MIKIYTLPNCNHCDKAKKFLRENNISYEEINLKEKENREAREYYRSLGVKTAPIIVSITNNKEDWILKEYNENNLIKLLEEIK